jgi:transcriptional regulatory protein RtcR
MDKTTVIGLLGTTLDRAGKGAQRWQRWRPTVSLCRHEDLLIDRFDLLYSRQYSGLLTTICQDIRAVSPETEIVPHEVAFHNPWDFEEVFNVLHSFSSSYDFAPDTDYLVHISTGTHVAQICLFLLTEAGYFPARLLQSGPGRNRSRQDSAIGSYSIIDLDLSRYDQIASRFQQEKQDDISFLKSGIATRSRAFNRLIEEIERVAANSREPILLAGPTGAGKSRLAQRIYTLKKSRNRVQGAFVQINCATLKGENGMAALFGHTRGAFTGAVAERPGLLRSADKGLLFLDEIGELGLDEQAMMLRAIEAKRFLPVGADQEVSSDFQLICGSNRNLHRHCLQGRFREDLLARINLWEFTLPGLRERPEDIAPNLDYELERLSRETGSRVTMNQEARQQFLDFATSPQALWQANFRDLRGAVIRMATLAARGRITAGGVTAEQARLLTRWQPAVEPEDREGELLSSLDPVQLASMDCFDRMQLARVIQVCRRSKSLAQAGRSLFEVSRLRMKKTNDSDRLRKYLARFGLKWQDICSG